MAALVPRRLADIADWFDAELRSADVHMIRVEDNLTENEYQLRAELPGVDPDKDVQITLDDGVLNIHAERQEKETTKGRSEFHYGMFDRSVRLPANADAAHITASYDKGMLEVKVPLNAPEPSTQKIPIASVKS